MGKREDDLGWSLRIKAHQLAKEKGLNREEELKILNELRKKEGMGEYIILPGCPDCDISYTPE